MNTKDDDGAEFFNKFGTPINAGVSFELKTLTPNNPKFGID